MVGNPNIHFTNELQRRDFAHGRIDRRIVKILRRFSRRHDITITAARSDHDKYTSSGSVSNHWYGRAIDIGAVNGKVCTGSRRGACGKLARRLAKLPPRIRPTELIYAFDADGSGPNAFADPAGHSDHVHVGFDE